ncbi:MAG: ATP-binding protein [Coriobacteriales bacterium]|jgi:predicted AAA+ superfamily ATPase|nr:ATP-binding protein [Coriobacteriales bacterium]
MDIPLKRDRYLQEIRPFVDTDVVKVLTGMRRSGKSVLLELIAAALKERGAQASHIISFNFEERENADLLTSAALNDKVDRLMDEADAPYYLLFDEIQEVAGWEKCVNALRIRKNVDLYLAGSNSRLLSSELATYLAGRYVTFAVYPLSFSEFLELPRYQQLQADAKRGDLKSAFEDYLRVGGMPFAAVQDLGPEPARMYLQDLFNSVILRDIVERHGVRSTEQLRRIIVFALANMGQMLSAHSVANYFKNEKRPISPETVMGYLKYCTEAFLLYKVPRNDLTGKKLLSTNEKYYCVDHALQRAIAGSGAYNVATVLENIVYLELLRRGYEVTVGKLQDKEVDFVATRGDEMLYLQVSYLLASPDTIAREFGVFEGIKDSYPRHVLSMDELDLSQNGVQHHFLPEFLLDESW